MASITEQNVEFETRDLTETSKGDSNLCDPIIDSINAALNKKNYPEVERLIEELSRVSPKHETSIKLAHIFYIQKKYVKAEQAYKNILHKVQDMEKAEVMFGLGQVYFETKMFSDSHMMFTIITNSFPDYKHINFIYLKLARIMINFKDFENAIKYLDKIIDSKNVNRNLMAEALITLAHIKEKQGKMKDSLEILQKSVRISKCFRIVASFVFTLVTAMPEVSNKACKNILKKRQLPGEWSDFCFIQALANIKLNNLEKAQQLLEEQTQSFPLNYFYSEYLGIVYLKQKENLKALEIFQKLRALFPIDTCNLNNLAIAYIRIGLKQEAYFTITAANSMLNKETIGMKGLKISEPYMDIFHFPTNAC